MEKVLSFFSNTCFGLFFRTIDTYLQDDPSGLRESSRSPNSLTSHSSAASANHSVATLPVALLMVFANIF